MPLDKSTAHFFENKLDKINGHSKIAAGIINKEKDIEVPFTCFILDGSLKKTVHIPLIIPIDK